jgi:signal transduction histidine kinase
MAASIPSVISAERIAELLAVLERIAGGEHQLRAPITSEHDALDAVAHAVNVLVGELDYALAGQRSAKELAESASRAKTALLRNVSHEMRTPLAAILALNEAFESPALDDARRAELARRISAHGRRLTALIDDLLDLSSLESGTLELVVGRVPLRDAIADAVGKLAAEAHARGIAIVAELPDGLDGRAIADARRVQQILAVVIGGAVRRSAPGELRVRLARDAGSTLTIDVVDRGPARSAREAEELFEPFTGADSLGFALARRLARAMNGDLAIVSGGVNGALRLSLAGAPDARPDEPTRVASALPRRTAPAARRRRRGHRRRHRVGAGAGGRDRAPRRRRARGRRARDARALRSDPDGHPHAGARRARGDAPAARARRERAHPRRHRRRRRRASAGVPGRRLRRAPRQARGSRSDAGRDRLAARTRRRSRRLTAPHAIR